VTEDVVWENSGEIRRCDDPDPVRSCLSPYPLKCSWWKTSNNGRCDDRKSNVGWLCSCLSSWGGGKHVVHSAYSRKRGGEIVCEITNSTTPRRQWNIFWRNSLWVWETPTIMTNDIHMGNERHSDGKCKWCTTKQKAYHSHRERSPINWTITEHVQLQSVKVLWNFWYPTIDYVITRGGKTRMFSAMLSERVEWSWLGATSKSMWSDASALPNRWRSKKSYVFWWVYCLSQSQITKSLSSFGQNTIRTVMKKSTEITRKV